MRVDSDLLDRGPGLRLGVRERPNEIQRLEVRLGARVEPIRGRQTDKTATRSCVMLFCAARVEDRQPRRHTRDDADGRSRMTCHAGCRPLKSAFELGIRKPRRLTLVIDESCLGSPQTVILPNGPAQANRGWRPIAISCFGWTGKSIPGRQLPTFIPLERWVVDVFERCPEPMRKILRDDMQSCQSVESPGTVRERDPGRVISSALAGINGPPSRFDFLCAVRE